MITSAEEFFKNLHLIAPIYRVTSDTVVINNKNYFEKTTITDATGAEREDYVRVNLEGDESINPKVLGYYEAVINGVPPKIAVLMPSNETIYDINLNTRTIESPEFLSTETDHYAETIYFKIDRYFDNMDLTKTVCLIQYENENAVDADGHHAGSFVYFVPFYDTKYLEYENKILIPWAIGGPATAAAGNITFAIRFYKLNADGTELLYNLNTMPAQSKILHGMNVITNQNENFIIPDNTVEMIYQAIAAIPNQIDFYWEDAF